MMSIMHMAGSLGPGSQGQKAAGQMLGLLTDVHDAPKLTTWGSPCGAILVDLVIKITRFVSAAFSFHPK